MDLIRFRNKMLVADFVTTDWHLLSFAMIYMVYWVIQQRPRNQGHSQGLIQESSLVYDRNVDLIFGRVSVLSLESVRLDHWTHRYHGSHYAAYGDACLGAIMKEACQFVGPDADPGSGNGFVPILVQVVGPETVEGIALTQAFLQ